MLPLDAAAPAWPARKPRLLLVDDQPVHLQVLYRTLSAEHQLFMATGGEQALRVAHEQLPDLILLDVVMPGLDGFAALRAERDTADIPVIFVTAHSGEDIETRCLEAGAVDFIPKPVNPSVVRARVRTHLTLKFQSDLLREHVRRSTDLVARYGGEEFACLLPDTGLDDAQRLAVQLLEAVRAMAIPHRHGTPGGVLTASFGVATRAGPAQPGWQPVLLLGLADAQLYEAKHQGRARVCAAALDGYGRDSG